MSTSTPRPTPIDVAIVGSGFGGIGMAAGLVRAGIRDYLVLERASEVGGTWRDNTYPGAACDVPSNLYSFSFAPNPDWSSSFSPQSEIQDYLRRCADRFGIRPRIRFNHEVTAATWNDATGRWDIESTGGRYAARILISARGPLSDPKIPAIDGIESFAGTIFHSARWDHRHRLDRERVAVIGTGASAIQFIPHIQPVAGRLHVYQRTPPWIIPRRDRRFTRLEHHLFRRAPITQAAARAAVYWGRETYVLGFVGTPARRRRMMGTASRVALRHLARQVPDHELRARLTPDYHMGCKRILISDDYYPAISQPNVDLVTSPIVQVRPHSILTADGTERETDTLIFGTGFDVTADAAASTTRGRSGLLLSDAWSDRMSAYKGTTVPGFPNLFLIVGPNSGLGHTSIVFVIESQIAYILDCLRTIRRRAPVVEVRPEPLRRWEAFIEDRSRQTVWVDGGCDSYYLDPHRRNVAIWPGSSWSLRRSLRHFDPEAYTFSPSPSPAPPPGQVAASRIG